MDVDTIITRLLTLLNASAVKPGKRKRDIEEPPLSEKLNKKRSVQFLEKEHIEKENPPHAQEVDENIQNVMEEEVIEEAIDEGERLGPPPLVNSNYHVHQTHTMLILA